MDIQSTGEHGGDTTGRAGSESLVVLSLEPWTEVKRRVRILVEEIADLDPAVRILYVVPPLDFLHELRQGKFGDLRAPRLRRVHPQVHILRPRKWLPRALGPYADRSLERQIRRTIAELGLTAPLLWVNDAGYARFAAATGWPMVYDITDDWLLFPLSEREKARLQEDERLLFERSGAVVVCSPDLERSRGKRRTVELIPNGVDVDLFRTAQSRPPALSPAPVALYVGTLHEARLDLPLIADLATARPDVAIVLLGPSSLPAEATVRLEELGNVHLVGSRPYQQVPAFLQHADVVIVPHLVSPFTESLDPIKAYECLAAGRPTVATPVAGFRDLGWPILVADREHFVEAVSAALAPDGAQVAPVPSGDQPLPTWRLRAETMAALMDRVRREAAAA